MNGQHSDDHPGLDLHALEQMALGGDATVRGYSVNGVASQMAVAASLQYNFAPMSFNVGEKDGKFRPNAFLDLGFAGQTSTTDVARMAAIGLGGEINIGENLIGSVHVANPLKDAGVTRKGDFSIAFQVTARF